MFGLLNIDKPPGVTSRDVVNGVQRLVRPHKVGHAGTLDPLATGVLVVALGPATRLVEYVQRMPKTYRAAFLLGRTSDTEDIEGRVEELQAPPIPTLERLQAALPSFTGLIEQRPPAYSALKIAGQPAYKKARRGESVELAPRPIEIHELTILSYEYPQLELLVRCGSGTYIRSLGRDLAHKMGTVAVMSSLRRLAIGPFLCDEALSFTVLSLEAIGRGLLPALAAVATMPQVNINAEEVLKLIRGQVIENRFGVQADEVAAVDSSSNLVAILRQVGSIQLRPEKCFTVP